MGISSAMNCISPKGAALPGSYNAVLTWAQLAPSSLWAAPVDTTAEVREGSEATVKGDSGLCRGGHDVIRLTGQLLTESQTVYRSVIPTRLTVTNFSRYSVDPCSRDENPSGHSGGHLYTLPLLLC